jgi:hypothetical protein
MPSDAENGTLTNEDHDEIIAAYASGGDVAAIEKRYGLTRDEIEWLILHNSDPESPRPTPPAPIVGADPATQPDDVWPISVDNPGPGSLRSFNGIGFGLKGFTRVDATGYCFATRWFMIAGLPLVPLDRYYLREIGLHPRSNYVETITRYQIAGTAELRPDEILRTYAFGWLTPVAVIVPLLLLLARADDFPFWVPITALVLWPTAAIVLVVMALMYYRKHWAPMRKVRWHEPN